MTIDAAQSLSPVGAHPDVVGTRQSPRRISGERPTTGVPFLRLVRVELRKMTDTRAGFWLLAATGLVIALGVGIMLFSDGRMTDFGGYLNATSTPVAIFIPIIGILAITSEWSQRTGLVTYTLEPRRGRVAWAKIAAAMLVGAVGVALSFGLAALGVLAGRSFFDGSGSFSIPGTMVVGFILMTMLSMAQGLAYGMVLRNTPAAIVLYFALPMVYSVLSSFSWFQGLGEWTDLNRTVTPLLLGEVSTQQWAQFATATGVWVIAPVVLGLILIRRAEVK